MAAQSNACALSLMFIAVSCLELEIALRAAKQVFRQKEISQIVSVTCTREDAVLSARTLAGDVRTSLSNQDDVERALLNARATMGVFVHIACPDSEDFLRRSSERNLFGGNLHWVLAGSFASTRTELIKTAESLQLAVDSEVTLAVAGLRTNDSAVVHLLDVYRLGDKHPILVKLKGIWSEEEGLRLYMTGITAVRRRDLQGITLYAGVMVDALQKYQLSEVMSGPPSNNHHVNPTVSFSHVLALHLQSLLNVTLLLQAGSQDILLRRIRASELHFITTAMVMKSSHWDFLDYAVIPLWIERNVLVLKNPGALWSYDALLLPLEGSVWLVILLVIVVTALMLRGVGYWEVRMVPGHQKEEDSWNTAFMTSMGMMTAQGFTHTTNLVSGRSLLFTFEVFSLCVGLFYSSSIVTFLLTFPPPAVRSVSELLDTSFVAGADGRTYNETSFTTSSDALTRELYWRKMDPSSGGLGFLDIAEGTDEVRDSRAAFMAPTHALYERLARDWSQSDICRLHEVQLRPPDLLGFGTAKRSPFKEMINQGLLLLVETGLRAREVLRWSHRRPSCMLNDVSEVDNVGLRATLPVIGVLAFGVLLGFIILGCEFSADEHAVSKSRKMIARLFRRLAREGKRRTESATSTVTLYPHEKAA